MEVHAKLGAQWGRNVAPRRVVTEGGESRFLPSAGMLTVFASLLLVPAAGADVLHVPKDYPTIQQAIDAAQENDEIVVSKGTYAEAIDFKGKNGIVLRGKKGKRPTIDAAGAAVAVDAGFTWGVTIRDLRIVGASLGIEVASTVGASIEDCRIEATGTGIDGIFPQGLVIRGCKIKGASGAGVDLGDVGEEAFGVVIEDNRILGCGGGILFAGQGLFARGNRIRDAADFGIQIDAGSGVTLEDNAVENVTNGDGIVLDADCERVTIAGNEVVAPSGDGVVLNGANVDEHVVADNTIRKCGAFGFRIQASDSLVSGNTIKKGERGIYLGVLASGDSVTKNKVRKAADVGLFVESSAHTFTFNDVRKSGSWDLQDTQFLSNICAGNVFEKVHP